MTRGTYSNNGASGIQIETGSKQATIDGAVCEDNGHSFAKEAGIWIDAAFDTTIRNCQSLLGNPYGITLSGVEGITITYCKVIDPERRVATRELGLRFLSGQQPTPLGAPFPGIRDLLVVGMEFEDMGAAKWISYGDRTAPLNAIEWTNNFYVGSVSPANYDERAFDVNGGPPYGYDDDHEALNFVNP